VPGDQHFVFRCLLDELRRNCSGAHDEIAVRRQDRRSARSWSAAVPDHQTFSPRDSARLRRFLHRHTFTEERGLIAKRHSNERMKSGGARGNGWGEPRGNGAPPHSKTCLHHFRSLWWRETTRFIRDGKSVILSVKRFAGCANLQVSIRRPFVCQSIRLPIGPEWSSLAAPTEFVRRIFLSRLFLGSTGKILADEWVWQTNEKP
jgi:hypothetical protein